MSLGGWLWTKNWKVSWQQEETHKTANAQSIGLYIVDLGCKIQRLVVFLLRLRLFPINYLGFRFWFHAQRCDHTLDQAAVAGAKGCTYTQPG